MVRIIKRNWLCFISVTIITSASYGQIDNTITEKFENICENTRVTHYYSIEEASMDRYTIAPSVMGINTDVLNLHFFSEVEDQFKIYVNGQLHSDIFVNTTLEDGGNTRLLDVEFPQGQDTFLLRIESLKYGCFETEARKRHPMLYIKHSNDKWWLDHNTVFEIPQFHFLKKPRNR